MLFNFGLIYFSAPLIHSLFFFTNCLFKPLSSLFAGLVHNKTWSYILAMVGFSIIIAILKVYGRICLILYGLANVCFCALFALAFFSTEHFFTIFFQPCAVKLCNCIVVIISFSITLAIIYVSDHTYRMSYSLVIFFLLLCLSIFICALYFICNFQSIGFIVVCICAQFELSSV